MQQLLGHLGGNIRSKALRNIYTKDDNLSIWFPYGWGRFGGHYTKGQLAQILNGISDEELGAKGMKLRGIVAAIVLTLGTAAYNSPLGDMLQSHHNQTTTASNSSK